MHFIYVNIIKEKFSYLVSLISIFLLTGSIFCQSGYYDFEKNNATKELKLQNINEDSTYDLRYYNLNIKINSNPNSITVNENIVVTTIISLNSVIFDFSNNMTVDSVKTGNIFLNFVHLNDKLIITLNQNYLPIQNISFIIFYHGTPVPTGNGSFIFGANNGKPSIWSLSEPFGASDWFVCKNSPDDKADSSSINITCKNNLTGVSNGKLIQIISNSDSTNTYCWKSSYPIANYLLSVAIKAVCED